MEDPKDFDIECYGKAACVSTHTVRSARIFHITFGDQRKPLNITIATDNDDNKFWTSVPEGRQDEAGLVGKLIAAYLRNYRKTPACAITTDKKLPAPNLFD